MSNPRIYHAEIVNPDGSPATTVSQADEVVRRTGAGVKPLHVVDSLNGIWNVEATLVVAHRLALSDVEYRLGKAQIFIPRVDGW